MNNVKALCTYYNTDLGGVRDYTKLYSWSSSKDGVHPPKTLNCTRCAAEFLPFKQNHISLLLSIFNHQRKLYLFLSFIITNKM